MYVRDRKYPRVVLLENLTLRKKPNESMYHEVIMNGNTLARSNIYQDVFDLFNDMMEALERGEVFYDLGKYSGSVNMKFLTIKF